LHHFCHGQQALDACEIDSMVVDHLLDKTQTLELFPRVKAHAPDRSARPNQSETLIFPQRLGMHSQLLGRRADEKQIVEWQG
jgi:hypothetical protein